MGGSERAVSGKQPSGLGTKDLAHTPDAIAIPGKQTLTSTAPARSAAPSNATRRPTFPAGAVPWSNEGGMSTASRLEDEDVELRAIVSGFRAAQHALDSVSDPAHAPAHCEIAVDHLNHVSHAVDTFSGDDGQDAEAIEAANSFSVSLAGLTARAPDAVPLRLQMLNALIRNGLGLGFQPPVGTPARREVSVDKSYVRNALPPALQLIAVRARDGLDTLEAQPPESPDRDAKVAELAEALNASSRYAASLLGQLTFQERHAFEADTLLAAAEMQKLVRWVRTRTPHMRMEQSFSVAMRSFDVVLRSVGLDTIERRDAATLSERAQDTAAQEASDVAGAAEELRTKVGALERAQLNAVIAFEELAKLDDATQPTLVETILKAVLMSTMGYVAGELIKLLTTLKPATPDGPAKTVADELRMLTSVGVGTANGSIQAAWAQVTKDNSVGLARIVFATAMRNDIGAKADAYREHVTDLTKESAVSPAELRAMADAFHGAAKTVNDKYVQQLAHGWATYLARSRLSTRSDGTANVHDYFGVPSPGGREFGTSKQASPGVLQLLMIVDAGSRAPRQDESATHIVGLNSQLTANVIANAGHEINKVRVPKELHVHAEFGRATIAVDEHNRFQDAIGWEQVHRNVGVTAYQFWKIYGGKLKLP